ncbi:MAG TPA: N-acetylmuramoyl-L-alanine amidase [bacterium]|nr:N-acetylmuramoyl-L-alanine amidase [bacterium]
MKKLFLCGLILIFCFSLASAQEQLAKIEVVTAEKTYSDIDLLLIAGMGYLKINDVAEVFDGKVDFDPVKNKASLELSQGKVEFFVDSTEVIIDNIKRKMKKETKIIEGRVWIPLEVVVTKAFGEVLGGQVSWDYAGKTLSTVEKMPGAPLKEEEEEVPPPEPEITAPVSPVEGVKKQRVRTIVIDPGHGGKDPGAIGPRGTKEKDVVLRIAHKLAKELHKNLKTRVILTRYHDVFLPLADRTAIANQQKADLFISIHCNASLKSRTKGFEVYFLSDEVSDEEAQAVANMENAVMALEERTEERNELSSILWSLTMNEFMNESSELCSLICSEVDRKLRDVENRGVKQAGFTVLRGAKMPAILVEAAFISNRSGERRLKSSKFQKSVVESICTGVKEYKEWVERW